MPQLNPIQRPSLTTSLSDRYAKQPVANVGNGPAQSAGTADSPGQPGATNMIDVPNSIQKDFQPHQPSQVTMYTDTSLNYAQTLGVNNTKYKG